MNPPIWQPSAEQIAQANLTRFMAYLRQQHIADIENYAQLYRWSIDYPAQFWPALWQFCEVKASQPWQQVLVHPEKMPGAQWFVGSRLNFAENLLRYRDEQLALIFRNEQQISASYTYRQLYQQVALLANALRKQGVVAGDRIAGFLPNIPEAIIAMLATASIGAVWSSCSPDFGIQGVLDRFSQIQPKVLFTADGYFYNGKSIDSLERISQVLATLPSVQTTVVIPYTNPRPNLDKLPHAILFPDLLAQANATKIEFAQLPFDHPLYIMYSSGTTGVPKCIVHSAGGTLLQHLKEHVLHTDLKRQDKLFYFTTCGWMMWNWLASGLATGATLLLYDGSPFYPKPETLFDFAEKTGMTIFGTSAKYIAAIEKTGVKLRGSHSLPHLKAILSTGSPLLPESYDYVYRDIKPDIRLCSISGGTDIISCFALGNPIAPIYRGELQTRGLGMKVEIFNETGQAVRQAKGELVCTAPFPSMPIYFWNDPDGSKYQQAYFARFAHIWCHGDYAELTQHDGLIIYGRSDAVLNPGGVRIGTAEIYRQVDSFPEILESIAVSQAWENDVRIILFVKLKSGLQLDPTLIHQIKQRIRDNASPRHVPAKIIAVADIPKTISGKIVELAVRNVIHGLPVNNTDALANPEALALFRDLPELAMD